MILPEIRIKDAWLFRDQVSVHLNELWGDGEPLRSDEEYEKIVKNYQKTWKPYEQKILTGMTEALDLSFRQKYRGCLYRVIFEPDRFVDILTHELIHRLLTDNTSVPNDLFLIPHWEKLFGKQNSWNTLVHIPVHAVHKHIYLDVLKEPKRLERDIERLKRDKAKDYLAAWDYVDKQGYKEINNKLRDMHKELGR